MTKLLILGSDIAAPLWAGFTKRFNEEPIDTVLCTTAQSLQLNRLGLSDKVTCRCYDPAQLSYYRGDRVLKMVSESSPHQIFLLGQVDPLLVIHASRFSKNVSFWEKAAKVDLDLLIQIFDLKTIENDRQVVLKTQKGSCVGSAFLDKKFFKIDAFVYCSYLQFVSIALTERVFDRVFVTYNDDYGIAPEFVQRWSRTIPGALVKAPGYSSSRLGNDGYEETWCQKIFAKVQVISEKEFSQIVG